MYGVILDEGKVDQKREIKHWRDKMRTNVESCSRFEMVKCNHKY
jgi:hypothetical protein